MHAFTVMFGHSQAAQCEWIIAVCMHFQCMYVCRRSFFHGLHTYKFAAVRHYVTTWNWWSILQLPIQWVQDVSSCGSLSTATADYYRLQATDNRTLCCMYTDVSISRDGTFLGECWFVKTTERRQHDLVQKDDCQFCSPHSFLCHIPFWGAEGAPILFSKIGFCMASCS